MYEEYWKSCYSIEKPYSIAYVGTDLDDPDSDGDGVRDGADDSDFDDIPNLMELSRFAASGYFDGDGMTCKADPDLPKPPDTWHPGAYGRVNPFNPCLPMRSRTCAKYVNDATGAPFDGSPNWYSLQ